MSRLDRLLGVSGEALIWGGSVSCRPGGLALVRSGAEGVNGGAQPLTALHCAFQPFPVPSPPPHPPLRSKAAPPTRQSRPQSGARYCHPNALSLCSPSPSLLLSLSLYLPLFLASLSLSFSLSFFFCFTCPIAQTQGLEPGLVKGE